MVDAGQLFGRGLGFPPRLGRDGRLTYSEGPENIRESIRIILMTEPGERVMLPEFGGALRQFLFQPNTVANRRLIEEEIVQSLARWEPRISVDAVNVDQDPDDQQSAIATIRYRLVATQASDEVSLRVRLAT